MDKTIHVNLHNSVLAVLQESNLPGLTVREHNAMREALQTVITLNRKVLREEKVSIPE